MGFRSAPKAAIDDTDRNWPVQPRASLLVHPKESDARANGM